MLRHVFATLMLAILSTLPVSGHAVENGTRTIVSDLSYWALITRLEAAIKRKKLKIISRASVRGAERQKKLGIPGNMVIGAFDDDYTTRILRANVAAGIEAPIRFYITRGADEKTATLWYRRPSWVLASYSDKTGDLRAVGEELDRLMATIAAEATKSKPRTNRVMVKREAPKRKAVKPAPEAPKARSPERVAKAAPKRVVKVAKPAAKRTKAAPKAAAKPDTAAAAPRKLAAPKPLTPQKTAEKPAAPVARTGPKPLTPAKLTPTKVTEVNAQQGGGAPVETARRSSEDKSARKPEPPTAKRDPDREAISLTPLMLKLQGQ
jgi:uncharacterized protein (DUF302 family)